MGDSESHSQNGNHTRETFIPHRRRDIVRTCLEDGRLDEPQKRAFHRFCDILTSYVHFKSQEKLERLKDAYAAFDPDADTLRSAKDQANAGEVIDAFRAIAREANYEELGDDSIEAAMCGVDLIDLNTEVDFDAYEHLICFARGADKERVERKRWFGLKRQQIEVDVWERVILILKFKDPEHFSKGSRRHFAELPIQPGCMYVHAYRMVPKLDLELIFPNVRLGMTHKDKRNLALTAIVGLIGIGWSFWTDFEDMFGFAADFLAKFINLENSETLYTVAAVLFIVMGIGGIIWNQVDAYRRKKTEFLKNVSQSLFFRHLATNNSVFHRILDNAEEEMTKEMILVYYHMTVNPQKTWTAEELDAEIEAWLDARSNGQRIDFHIRKASAMLSEIRGEIDSTGKVAPLLEIDDTSRIRILPLDQAMHAIDFLWDTAYEIYGD